MSEGESDVPADDGRRSLNDWLARIEAAERSGDVLMTADLAASALEEHPDEPELEYRHLLSLARGGALRQAERLWPRYALPQDDIRFASLGARLLRERALRSGGRAALLAAAGAYVEIFQARRDPFPGINAAVLLALAGQQNEARTIAKSVLALVGERRGKEDADAFNLAADALTALLILGQEGRAAVEAQVLLRHAKNAAALTSTRRQLKRLTTAMKRGEGLLALLAPKPSLHFSGHMISGSPRAGRFPPESEQAVHRDIEAFLESQPVGVGYGSLASGGDILVVEALARRAVPFHIVLPFDLEDFLKLSVRPGGGDWEERFHRLLPQAASITYATEGSYLGDAAVFGYCARLAMGMARLRAEIEDAQSLQLAIWDERQGNNVAGTASDIALWQSFGLNSYVISSRPAQEAPAASGGDEDDAESGPALPERPLRAFLFGDFRGFSRLSESQLLTFNRVVLPAVARVLNRFPRAVEVRQTWGDGLYLVFDDVSEAAACALAIEAEVVAIDRAKHGLPENLGLRAALHAGPVFAVNDPVMRQQLYTGRHISRAARMEPVTPEGEIYVSEGFAALLALENRAKVSYEYVGRVPLAKEAGHLRMYLLRAA